jgi:two-component system NtrC family response regulator
MMTADPTTTRPRLLIVDDDPSILRQLKWGLDEHFEVITASTVEEAVERVRSERPGIITLDLALSEGGQTDEGFALLDEFLALDRSLKIVLITGNDTRENALRAVDRGAFDFFSKPVDLEELKILLRRAAQLRALEEENARLQEHLRQSGGMGGIQGSSEEIQKVFQMIRRVASTDVTVLITGESGTGKELVAREVHRQSHRADRPFISIACGAIPEALLEAELFGHEKGSFTGAHVTREGKLEMANGGTVFLDEIGELPLNLQVKLLRFLQEKEVERIGGRKVIPLDVRILAATNRDLRKEVETGNFREDLFFRLSVVNVAMPPLRNRHDDVLFLARHFLNRFAQEYRRGPLHFSREALRVLQRYEWPGNIRELEHRVQRAVVMSTGRTVRPSDLDLAAAPAVSVAPLKTVREQAERQLLVESLKRNCGNITRSARELAISRPTYHDLLKKYRIHAGDYKNGNGPE